MRSIVIGMGEVGQSLYNVLKEHYEVFGVDKNSTTTEVGFEVMHVCFPPSETFVEQVLEYQKKFQPKYTVIHSTVEKGISRQCNAVHSPIVGIHPHLEKSIRTFTRFLAGEQASEVADYFRRAGMKVYLFDKPEITEIIKRRDTTLYGLDIEFTKDTKKELEADGLPFEAWTVYVNDYNRGYVELGFPEFVRPNLVPIMKKIGGHCVLQNCVLHDDPFTKLLTELNKNER